MTLEEFAKLSGVVVIECDAEKWGGAYGFKTKGSNSSVCGCESPEAAYRSWAEREFGEEAAQALSALLSESGTEMDKLKAAARRVIRHHDLGTISRAPGDSVSVEALRELVKE